MAVTIQELRGVVTANITDFRRKMNTVVKDTREFRSTFSKTTAAISKAGGSMATAIHRVGLAAAGATTVVVKNFAKFEETMTRVGAVTQTLGTKDFKLLEDAAKQAGETTRFTASQSAEAMESLGLAGFNTTQIIQSLPGALQLASAAQVDIGTAADIAAKAMRAFGLDAKEMGRINDTLVATFTKSNTDLRQLAEALKPVGPVSKAVGVSLEDTAAILAKMSDAGFQGSLAGTSLRNALIRLAAPSREAEKLLDKFGVTAGDTLFQKMQKIDKGMAGLANEQEKLAAAAEIFGVRGGPAMLAVFETGVGAVQDFSLALQQSGGLASRIEQANLQTLQARLDLLKSKIEAVFIGAGSDKAGELKAAIDGLTQSISDNAPQISQFVSELLKLATAVAKFVAEHPRLSAMLVALSAARLLGITTALRDMGGAFLSIGTSTKALMAGGGSGGGIVRWLGAMRTASLAAKAGVLALATVAIVALAKKIYENMPAIKAWNRELEKGAKLNDKLAERTENAQDKILAQAASMEGADRQSFLADQLSTAQKNLVGLESRMNAARKQYEDYQTGWRDFTGNKVLADFKNQLDETTAALDRQKGFVTSLETELAGMGGGPAPDPAAGIPAAIGDDIAESVGEATVEGLKKKQDEISSILKEAQLDALSESAPDFQTFSDFLSAGATPDQLNELINEMLGGQFHVDEISDDVLSAPTRLSDMQAGGASPEQVQEFALSLAEAFQQMRNQSQLTRDAAAAAAEQTRAAWESAQPTIDTITANFANMPVEQANEFELQLNTLFDNFQNGAITVNDFSRQISALASESQQAADATAKELQQKRQAALLRGDFAGAGMNFQQSVQQRLQEQLAQFQQGRFDAAVQQMVNGMLGLQGATEGLQGSFGNFGEQLSDFGSSMQGIAGDLKGGSEKAGQAFNQLAAFLNSRQGQINAIQNQISLLQQTLSIENLSYRRREQVMSQIDALMARLLDLMRTAPPVLGDFRADPIFEDPGLQGEESGGGGRRTKGAGGNTIVFNSTFPPGPGQEKLLVDAIESEIFRRGRRI